MTDDGIVYVHIVPGVVQALPEAEENMSNAIAVTKGIRRPLLVDIRKSEMLRPEARHHYSSNAMNGAFSALALLTSATPLGSMMGNIYLRMSKHSVPVRLFTSQETAIEWLKTFH